MKLIVILLYFLVIAIIGVIASKSVKSSKDFVLGGRKFNAITTALGAGAADMSAWLMMALPGAVYLSGISEIWYPIGLIVGAYLNWQFVARRLRIYTQKHGNALTIPSYLANRFNDNSGIIKLIAVIMMSIFFVIYIASALIALALLVNTFTNFEYTYCLWFGALFIFIYTSIGGFMAVTWTDVMQGSLMLFALLIVPFAIIMDQNSLSSAYSNFQTFDINIHNPFLNIDTITIISLLSWGVGYFGQPHILVRFMAIKQSRTMKVSQKICMLWMILSLIGAFCVGLFGKFLFVSKDAINPESIFLLAADRLFPEWLAGIVLAAVLSAIMSTISSQLHAISCSLTEINSAITHKIWHTRLFMVFVIVISTAFAHTSHDTILGLVAFAWAGLGSAFGPIIVFSLYSNKVTKQTAIYGMLTGGITVLIWHALKSFGGIFVLYEIIPGFILSSVAIFIKADTVQRIKLYLMKK
jgi:sodium/proline symporter